MSKPKYQVGEQVEVTIKGEVVSVEKWSDGKYRYEVRDEDNTVRCYEGVIRSLDEYAKEREVRIA